MSIHVMEPAGKEQRMQEFAFRCQEAGIRLTHQRREIFREILQSRDHPTVEEVFQRVKQEIPTLSRDTVYRTLWMLREMSLIGTVGYPYRSIHFDGDHRRHDHFLCNQCGGIVDLEIPEEHRSLVDIGELGRVDSTYVEYRGLCKQCLKNTGSIGPSQE